MLIVDEGTALRHAKAKVVERTREITRDGAQNEGRDAHWVADKDKSVANLLRQTGRKLSPEKFMQMLNTLNKDIVLEPHPGVAAPKDTAFHRLNKDKACLHLKVGGKKIFLFVVEGDWMPEWSLFDTKEIRVPDASRPELPWQKREIPWHKTKRGWREALIMLIHKKLVSVEEVERVFGAGDRPSWKILTGKGTGSIY